MAFQEEPRSYMQELVEDLVAMVASFAARIHCGRGRKYMKVVEGVGEAVRACT